MNKLILIGGAVIIVGAGVFFYFQSSQQSPQEEMREEMMPPSSETSAGQGEEMMGEEHSMMTEHVVVYSSSGYAPKELTIKKGDKVTFRNESNRETWPASALHPSHAMYPGSSIGKCDTGEREQIFDACHGLKKGEEWFFVFDEVGVWGYHDHLNPSMFGKIIMEE